MSLDDILALPVARVARPKAHLYLWVPNALLREGLAVMERWGFAYKSNVVWYKVRKDGGPDRRGVGFYFRNVTELCLFGVRGAGNRTLAPGRTQPNIVVSCKREHSRKPDELYDVIESCSPAPYLELFARHPRVGWLQWGNEVGAPKAKVFRAYGGTASTPRERPSRTPRVTRLHPRAPRRAAQLPARRHPDRRNMAVSRVRPSAVSSHGWTHDCSYVPDSHCIR
jgi:N6-adenosine-specific RNA methylase IME4